MKLFEMKMSPFTVAISQTTLTRKEKNCFVYEKHPCGNPTMAAHHLQLKGPMDSVGSAFFRYFQAYIFVSKTE